MADRLVNVTLTANTAPYVAGMNSATAATQRTAATAATANTGLKKTGATMATTAGQAGLLRSGLTTPIAAAGAAIIGTTKASIDWESAWAGVTKTVDGSEKQLSALEGDLRGMAKTLPATHGEIASVAEAAGQLGVATEDVADFSKVMIDLGETTNLTADQAATSLARFGNIMGTSQDDVERLGSTIVDLGNNSETTEAEILTLGQRLAAAGKIAGLSESDVLAFAATLTSVGVEAEAGGTALSKVFQRVRDATLNGGKALETFAEVAGVSADEFVRAFEEDPAAAIAMFIEGLGRMNAAGKSTTGVFEDLELTDQRLMRALLSTAEAGDLLTDSLELGNKAWSENTALAEEAEKRYGTTAAQLSMSMNTLKDAAIDVGGLAAPVLADAAGLASDLVSGLQLGINKMREMQLQVAKDAGATDEEAAQSRTGFLPIDVLRGAGQDVEFIKGLFSDTADETQNAAEWAAKYDAEIQGLASRAPEVTEEQERINRAMANYSMETRTATERAQAYQDQLRASVDPVFAMFDAVTDADEAQKAYNEAVDEYGKNSPEARDASIDLARAVSSAQQAALDGELSFDQFEAKLARWVEQGVISEEAAKTLKGAVKDLREESEDYKDTYKGQFQTGGTSKSRAEINGLNNRARRWRGRHKANFQTGGTSKAQAEINGLLNRAYAWHGSTFSATVNLGATGSGLGYLFGSAFTGHSGGMVTNAGIIPRMHDGGMATTAPRFHAGSSRLASDEVPAILQTGEMVLSRAQVAMMERARYLELVARGMVRLGDVTDDEWEQLLALGWQGKAGDRMEALYPPLEGARREFIKLGEVTKAEWERLMRLGWQGKAGDRMEALYPPLDSLAVEAGKAAELLRDANLNRISPVTGNRRTYDFFRSGGKSFAHIFGTGETLALGQMGEMQAGRFLRAMGKIPKAHDGASVVGANEGLAVLKRGEEVMSAQMVSSLERAMAPVARAPMGGGGSGVMEFRHTFAPGPGGNGAFAHMANEALRKGELNIKTEAIAR